MKVFQVVWKCVSFVSKFIVITSLKGELVSNFDSTGWLTYNREHNITSTGNFTPVTESQDLTTDSEILDQKFNDAEASATVKSKI